MDPESTVSLGTNEYVFQARKVHINDALLFALH